MSLELESAVPAMRPRLSEVVLDHIKNKILSGALLPGDELPSETELANAFHISKPTVRDALRYLSVLGLIDIRQGKPSTIGQVKADTLSLMFRFAIAGGRQKFKDIIEIRKAIECIAAPAAALNITESEISELRKIVDKLNESKNKLVEWVVWDVAFHRFIAATSRNTLLPFLMDALRGIMEDEIHALYAREADRDPGKTFQRHAVLANAIIQRNQQLALSLMQEHFDASEIIVAAQMDDFEYLTLKK